MFGDLYASVMGQAQNDINIWPLSQSFARISQRYYQYEHEKILGKSSDDVIALGHRSGILASLE